MFSYPDLCNASCQTAGCRSTRTDLGTPTCAVGSGRSVRTSEWWLHNAPCTQTHRHINSPSSRSMLKVIMSDEWTEIEPTRFWWPLYSPLGDQRPRNACAAWTEWRCSEGCECRSLGTGSGNKVNQNKYYKMYIHTFPIAPLLQCFNWIIINR